MNLIVVKFELDTEKRTGGIRPEVLSDSKEKKAMLGDPEINELLQNIVSLSERKAKRVEGEEAFQELLSRELDTILEKMVLEQEGLRGEG